VTAGTKNGSAARTLVGGEILGRGQIDRDVEVDCDVVVVGSGAGGAVAAAEFAEAGLSVVVIEEGHHWKTEDFSFKPGQAIRRMYRDAGASMTIGNVPVMFQEGRAVGGSTVINGGMSWRTPEKVLRKWVLEDGLPDMSPRDMERYFERVEKRISARTQDVESLGRDTILFSGAAKRLGYKTIDNIRNQVHCAGSNNCAWGCPTGAKRSMLLTYVPRAVSRGARIFSDCRVHKILKKGKQALGVEGRFLHENGKPSHKLTVRARLTVVAGGSAQTPALLWRSGFRSPSGQLGKNLTLHPNGKVIGIFDEDVKGWTGVHQGHQVREFIDEGFLMTAVNVPPSVIAMTTPYHGRVLGDVMRQYNQMVVAGILVEDTTTGHVKVAPGGRPFLFYDVTDIDVARIKRGLSLVCEVLFEAGAKKVLLPFSHLGELQSADQVRRIFEVPIPKREMEIFTVHLMSSCRMSGDAVRSVCDEWGQFRDATGLMISDASMLPGPIGVNPMESILAVATRNAMHVLETPGRYLT